MIKNIEINALLKPSNELFLHQYIIEGRAQDAIKYIDRQPKTFIFNQGEIKPDGLYIDVSGTDYQEINIVIYKSSVKIRRYTLVTVNGDENQKLFFCDLKSEGIFSQNQTFWQSPLHLAAQRGMTEVVKGWLNKTKACTLSNFNKQQSTFVNLKDGYGRTALHYAAMGGHEKTIRCLLEWGANLQIRDTCYQTIPIHFLKSKIEGYSQDFLELFFNPDPYSETFQARKSNELHQFIENYDQNMPLAAACNICLELLQKNFLVKDPRGCLPSEIAQRKKAEQLKAFLSLHEMLASLNARYSILLIRKKTEKEKNFDSCFIALLSESLDVIEKVYENRLKLINSFTNSFFTNLFKLTGCISYQITFDIQKQFPKLFPKDELTFLAYLAFKENDSSEDKLPGMLNDQLAGFVACISRCRDNLNEILKNKADWYDSNKITENLSMESRQLVEDVQALYDMVNPFMDQRILKKMVQLGEKARCFDVATRSGRIALLAIVKLIGELCKYTNQFRHLHPAIKNLFSVNYNWTMLAKTRDYIAKAVSRPMIRANYLQLIDKGDTNLFNLIKNDISIFTKDVEIALITLNKFRNYSPKFIK